MKVIFLDFDGVINNWNNFDGIDVKCVEILKYIKETTNSYVVATSSNKYSFQAHGQPLQKTRFYQIVMELKNLGIEIQGITPLVNKNKSLEIQEYLENHKEVTQYVILDDEYIGAQLKEHQVFLDLYRGLQEEHIMPSINILNGKLGFYPPNYNTKETPEELNLRINKHYLTKKG